MVTEKDKEMMDVMARGGKKKANPQVAKAKAELMKMMQESVVMMLNAYSTTTCVSCLTTSTTLILMLSLTNVILT